MRALSYLYTHIALIDRWWPPLSHSLDIDRAPRTYFDRLSAHGSRSFTHNIAQFPFLIRQYTSKNSIESCGGILQDVTRQMVCLTHLAQSGIWTLPRGRRNVGKSCQQAAPREIYDETRCKCRTLSVNMFTRAPYTGDTVNALDVPSIMDDATESFMVTMRTLRDAQRLKIIW
jgi:hypothetical protein